MGEETQPQRNVYAVHNQVSTLVFEHQIDLQGRVVVREAVDCEIPSFRLAAEKPDDLIVQLRAHLAS